MNARDIMVSPVITVTARSLVRDAAKLMLERQVSGLPVVDDDGKLVGIVSEGDLMRRTETGTERRRSWWLRLVAGEDALASEYAKANARKVGDVMTSPVVTATPTTSVREIADLFEKHAIKRVPILSDGQLVGIVSRANVIQLVASAPIRLEVPVADKTIRDKLLSHLRAQPWSHTWQLNVTVNGGIVDLWGLTYSDEERRAIRVAAENIPGVRAVNDRLYTRSATTLYS